MIFKIQSPFDGKDLENGCLGQINATNGAQGLELLEYIFNSSEEAGLEAALAPAYATHDSHDTSHKQSSPTSASARPYIPWRV
jgi:hypothetical protein